MSSILIDSPGKVFTGITSSSTLSVAIIVNRNDNLCGKAYSPNNTVWKTALLEIYPGLWNDITTWNGRFVVISHSMMRKINFHMQYLYKNTLVHLSNDQVKMEHAYFYDNSSQFEKNSAAICASFLIRHGL